MFSGLFTCCRVCRVDCMNSICTENRLRMYETMKWTTKCDTSASALWCNRCCGRCCCWRYFAQKFVGVMINRTQKWPAQVIGILTALTHILSRCLRIWYSPRFLQLNSPLPAQCIQMHDGIQINYNVSSVDIVQCWSAYHIHIHIHDIMPPAQPYSPRIAVFAEANKTKTAEPVHLFGH